MRQTAVRLLFDMFLSFLVALFVSGCPVMMPAMVGGAGGAGHGLTKGDGQFEITLDALLGKAVDEVFEVRGAYETIILDETGLKGAPITTAAFRESFLVKLRTYREWKVLDKPLERAENQPDAARVSEGYLRRTALLTGELIQEGKNVRLMLRLADAETARPCWSGTFSMSMEALKS